MPFSRLSIHLLTSERSAPEDDLDDAWGSDTFGSSDGKAVQLPADVMDEPAARPKAKVQKKLVVPKVRQSLRKLSSRELHLQRQIYTSKCATRCHAVIVHGGCCSHDPHCEDCPLLCADASSAITLYMVNVGYKPHVEVHIDLCSCVQ